MPDSLPDLPQEMLDRVGDAVEGVVTPDPVVPTNDSPVESATPEGQGTGEAATAAPDSFTKLDPNALPPEVRPYYDSMLADYTRKTQQAAPWRKLGEELGVDSPDAVREAAELYAYLQDPNNLRDFHTRLGGMLGQAVEPATEPQPEFGADGFGGDPDLQALNARIDQLQNELQQRDAQAQVEQMQWALLGEVNRQEALLKEAHPDWGDSDGENISDEWQAVWNLSVATNGDLMAAAQIIEAAQNSAVTRLLNQKQSVSNVEGLALPTPGTVQTPPAVDEDDHDLRGPTKAAMEYLRGLVNHSE